MRSTRNPDVKRLQTGAGYRQILELDFNDMIPFVISNIKRKGIASFLYMGINMLSIIYIIFYIISGLMSSEITWQLILRQSLAGLFTGTILIIPIHELLHGLVYRFLGANKIRFGADMKQFIFYVTADSHPVSGRNMFLLALTPFIVINSITIALVLTWFPQTLLFAAFLLFSHNIMCIGDFAVVNFVQLKKGRIYNYDDIEKKKSYFYEELIL